MRRERIESFPILVSRALGVAVVGEGREHRRLVPVSAAFWRLVHIQKVELRFKLQKHSLVRLSKPEACFKLFSSFIAFEPQIWSRASGFKLYLRWALTLKAPKVDFSRCAIKPLPLPEFWRHYLMNTCWIHYLLGQSPLIFKEVPQK